MIAIVMWTSAVCAQLIHRAKSGDIVPPLSLYGKPVVFHILDGGVG